MTFKITHLDLSGTETMVANHVAFHELMPYISGYYNCLLHAAPTISLGKDALKNEHMLKIQIDEM